MMYYNEERGPDRPEDRPSSVDRHQLTPATYVSSQLTPATYVSSQLTPATYVSSQLTPATYVSSQLTPATYVSSQLTPATYVSSQLTPATYVSSQPSPLSSCSALEETSWVNVGINKSQFCALGQDSPYNLISHPLSGFHESSARKEDLSASWRRGQGDWSRETNSSSSVSPYVPFNDTPSLHPCALPFSSNIHSPLSSSLVHTIPYSNFKAPPPAHAHFHDASVHRLALDDGHDNLSQESRPFDARLTQNQDGAAQQPNYANEIHCDCLQRVNNSSYLSEQSSGKGAYSRLVFSEEKVMPVSIQSEREKSLGTGQLRLSPKTERKWTPLPNNYPVSLSQVNSTYDAHGKTRADEFGSKNTCSQQGLQSDFYANQVRASAKNIASAAPVKEVKNITFKQRENAQTSVKDSGDAPCSSKPMSSPFQVVSSFEQGKEKRDGETNCSEHHLDHRDSCSGKADAKNTDGEHQEEPEHDLSDIDKKAETTMLSEPSKRPKHAKIGKNYPVKQELQEDGSSTSEYELSPSYKVSLVEQKKKKRGLSQRSRSLRQRNCTVSFAEDSDDSDVTVSKRAKRNSSSRKGKRLMSSKTDAKKSKSKSGTLISSSKINTKAKSKAGKNGKTCSVCFKTFGRTDSLTVHMRVHTGDRPYQCTQCDATYKVSSHLQNHVRSKHSNSRPYKCEKCGKAFAYPTAKRRHEKICGKDVTERLEFHCSLCLKGFVTAQGFERHQNQNSCILEKSFGEFEKKDKRPVDKQLKKDIPEEKKIFKCDRCGKMFVEFCTLDRHKRFLCGKAPSSGPYKCPECDKVFEKRYCYIVHSRRHTGDRPYQCPNCDARFFDKKTWIKHVRRHDGNKIFECCLCEKKFIEKRSLFMHIMRVHCGMKPYKCNECDKDFASASLLSTHIQRIHRNEKRFKCQLCGLAFFTSQAWMRHMLSHANIKKPPPTNRRAPRQYSCVLCSQEFTMVNMRFHVATEHPGVALSEAVNKKFETCDVCFKEFSDQETLRVHKMRHTGVKRFKCDKCDKAFFSPSDLSVHQRKHSDARPYQCDECKQTFRWSASLRDHKMNLHNPDTKNGNDAKKFTCKECGHHFKRLCTLNTHMIRHRSVMPYICSVCGKGFINNCRLKIHMTCHSGDGPRPFVCETCGDGFFYSFLLKNHIQRKHMPSPWLCNLCGKSLCSKNALKRHIANHAKSPDGKIRKGKRSIRTQNLEEPKEFMSITHRDAREETAQSWIEERNNSTTIDDFENKIDIDLGQQVNSARICESDPGKVKAKTEICF